MIIDTATPALLFPAISLLLLAYTNRFVATASLIRGLSRNAREGEVANAELQIRNLKKRMDLIKIMQFLGVSALLLCTISMFFLFIAYPKTGSIVFGISLFFMCGSLLVALREISISTGAIETELDYIHNKHIEHERKREEETNIIL